MSDRPLFEALADVAREQHELEREDPKLAAWQKGELSPEEAASLDLDPLDRALFQPVSAAKKAELAQKVIAPQNKVVRLIRWPWITALAASIMFAAIFLRSPDHETLPPYTLSISSGAMDSRSEQITALPVFERDTTLQLILRPDRATTSAPGHRAFLVRGDRWMPWAPPASIDPSGAILVEGQTSELLAVEPGEWTIVFVLAPADDVENAARRVASGDRRGAVVLEQKILVR